MPRLTDSYSKKELDAMVTIPTKAGLWLRMKDLGGEGREEGDYCDRKELEAADKASEKILNKFDNINFIKGLVSYYRNEHSFEDLMCYDVRLFEQDLKEALLYTRKNCPETDLRAFKIVIFETAEAVAKAAGSWGLGFHNVEGSVGGIWGSLGALSRLGRGPRVSNDEKKALNDLIDLLGADGFIRKYEEYK